jgi:hypothetical protein
MAVVSVLCALAVSSSAYAEQGTFVTFDVPGAGTASFQGTLPFSLNPSGAITGYYVDAAGVYHGFLRAADGTITAIDPPGSVFTQAWNINEAGSITGDFCDKAACHGFLQTANGTLTPFDVPGAVFGVSVFGATPEGTVAGAYPDANFLFHGFLRTSEGALTTIDAPGAAILGTLPLAINPQGTVAGCYTDANFVGHGFVRAKGGALTSFDPPSSRNVQCLADYGFFFFPSPIVGINAAGAITGSYFEPIQGNCFGGNYRGFLRSPDGSFTTFDAVPSPSVPCATWTFGIAVNPAGVVAGWDNDFDSVSHGFVRAKDGTVTLLDAPGAGTIADGFNPSQGTFARSINPGGLVTGFYVDANTVYHGFLWIPPSH